MKGVNSSELYKSEPILRAIIETAIDGIVIIDKTGVIRIINRAVCEMFRSDMNDLIGNNVSILMPEPHKAAHNQYINNFLKPGKARIIGIGREVEGRRSDGSLFPIRLAVSELGEMGDGLFAGFIHDLSEVKAAEAKILKLNEQLEQNVAERTEELQDAINALLDINKQLEREIREKEKMEAELRDSREELEEALETEKELNELKSRFVSTASHEFRTPLSTILSSTALIGRYTESSQQAQRDKHLNRIRSSVNTLNSILNDFLSLSKIEEGKIAIRLEEHKVYDVLSEVNGDIEGLLKDGQKVKIDVADDHANLVTDKQILKNILFNLISNAIKYSPEKSEIRCSAQRENSHMQFAVADTGIGIPLHEQKHLFSRFFRASNATNIQGTGLGLNIVSGYVEMLGGDISFTSVPGQGSTFIVKIPIETNGKDTGD